MWTDLTLDPAFVNTAAEVLDHDADDWQRKECKDREPHTDVHHQGERQRGERESLFFHGRSLDFFNGAVRLSPNAPAIL